MIAEYDGEPNGLKIHRDGRIFVADYKNGIMLVDPESGRVTPWYDRYRLERFKGCNDLIFGAGGEMSFTDQGQTGPQDASARVFRPGPEGRLACLIYTIPSPNRIAVHPSRTIDPLPSPPAH